MPWVLGALALTSLNSLLAQASYSASGEMILPLN